MIDRRVPLSAEMFARHPESKLKKIKSTSRYLVTQQAWKVARPSIDSGADESSRQVRGWPHSGQVRALPSYLSWRLGLAHNKGARFVPMSPVYLPNKHTQEWNLIDRPAGQQQRQHSAKSKANQPEWDRPINRSRRR